jgi:hypothetical protein
MNKKEISEIRRQFTYENCTISRIAGCYVNAEKKIQAKSKDAFLSLPEEVGYKYLDLMKKTLSGQLGKNLLEMEFPLESEAEGGTQAFLLKLRDSGLEEDNLLDQFYEKVIETYFYKENYYIIVAHATYDVPGKASDETEMFDASDNVYEYLLCSICPVKLSKEGLSFDPQEGNFVERIRDWIVDRPSDGFLFPAFSDRCGDIHHILYYTKKPEDLQEGMIQDLFGCETPFSAGSQMGAFNKVIMDTLEEDCDFETVKEIHSSIYDMLEESKDEPDPLVLSKREVRGVMEKCGVPNEKMEKFDEEFSQAVEKDDAQLQAANLVNTRQFSVTMPDISIKVAPEKADLVTVQEVDGHMCVVIPINDQVEINGVPVRPKRQDS